VLGVPGTGELILKKIPLSIFIPLVAGIITEIEFSDIFLSMK
jgi:hypothetical protein